MAEKGFKRKRVTIFSAYAEIHRRHMDKGEKSTARTLATYLSSKSFKLLNP